MKQSRRWQRILLLSLLSISFFAPLILVSNRLQSITPVGQLPLLYPFGFVFVTFFSGWSCGIIACWLWSLTESLHLSLFRLSFRRSERIDRRVIQLCKCDWYLAIRSLYHSVLIELIQSNQFERFSTDCVLSFQILILPLVIRFSFYYAL